MDGPTVTIKTPTDFSTAMGGTISIVSNQIYRPLLIFGVVGVMYFAMCWPLSIYGSKLERRLSVGR